jgi:hypothetical protein
MEISELMKMKAVANIPNYEHHYYNGYIWHLIFELQKKRKKGSVYQALFKIEKYVQISR